MTVYYFSATGNSLYVARALGGKQISVAQAIKRGEYIKDDDIIGLVFPIYGLGMPSIVRRFIKQSRWNAQYRFVIGTYGAYAGAAMPMFAKLAAANGIKFDYTDTIKMTDNYLPSFKMEDQAAKLPAKKVEEKLRLIAENVRIRHKYTAKAGVFARISSIFLAWFLNMFHARIVLQARKYIVNDSCVKCGLCATVCPVHNIRAKGERPVFGDHCEGCLACAHLCPQGAIHLRNEKSEARFRNEGVSVDEIAAANRQMRDKA